MQLVGIAISLLFIAVGLATVKAFVRPNPEWQQIEFQQFQSDNPPKLDHTKK